jgi:hypothetical protein
MIITQHISLNAHVQVTEFEYTLFPILVSSLHCSNYNYHIRNIWRQSVL